MHVKPLIEKMGRMIRVPGFRKLVLYCHHRTSLLLRAAATAAGMFLRKLRKLALKQRLNGSSNGQKVPAEINLNPHLAKPHERTKSHTACDQLGSTFIGQISDRRHAPTLLMRNIGDHIHFFD
jgi:hypothetical protein